MSRAPQTLTRFAAIFASGTLVSRVAGLARDATLTRLIPTASLDAFLVAFRLPNMLRDLVGEGAMNAAFVPVFSATKETEPAEAFRELVSACLSAMLLLLAAVSVAGVLLAPVLLSGINALETVTGGTAHDEAHIALMASLTAWVFPYIFLIGMAVFAMGPLFTVGHYTTPSWTPVLLNLSLIAACLFLRDWFSDPAYALAAGVWLGGVSQLAVQYVALGRYTGVWLPNFRLRHPGVKAVFVLMGPLVIGQAAGEVNKLVDLTFAASLEKGTVTALFCANRLVQLPLAVFAMATAAAVLPALSRAAARDDTGDFRETLVHAFRQTYFLVLPATLGLIVLREPLVALVFEGQEFSRADSERTATALGIYALGLLGFAGVKVAVPGYFALRDTRTPVIVSSASMALNIALNVALVRELQYKGLALATSIAFTVNFLWLYAGLIKRHGPLWDRASLDALLRMTMAGLVMMAAVYGVTAIAQPYLDGAGFASRALLAGLGVGTGVATYGAAAMALGIREVTRLAQILRRR